MQRPTVLVTLVAGLSGILLGTRVAESDAGGLESLDVALAVEEAYQDLAARALPAVLSVNARRGEDGWGVSRGAGVLVRPDGIAVTNNHVVEGARSLWVELHDGTRVGAEVLGTDPEADLAVLRLERDEVPYLPLSRDPSPPIGTMVVAIGQPGGLTGSVTSGIVSATGRVGLRVATFEDFLQTDAAINPGNSGGPLVDLRGRVVGINVAKGTEAGGSVGIGFAIPAHQVARTVEDIVATGRVRRGWLGIEMQALPARRAVRLGLSSEDHVAIGDVVPASPAEAAGLRPGDVVLRFRGERVASTAELLDRVAALHPGDRVALEVWRDGAQRQLDVTLGERPAGDL